jgi:outer membrane receptor protein involved in Fe transport
LNSDGRAWDHPQNSDDRFGLLKINHGPLDAIFSYSRRYYADTYRSGTRDRFWTREPAYGSVKYNKAFSCGARLTTSGFYESYAVDKSETHFQSGVKSKVTGEEMDSSLYGAEVETAVASEHHDLVFAVSLLGDRSAGISVLQSFPVQTRTSGLSVPSVHRTDVGVMVQDVWSLTEKMDVTVGLRYDALSDFRNQLSYRVGFTGEHKSLYGKALLGTAYRVPSFREYLDVLSYNNALHPESLRTYEVQIGNVFSKGDVNVTVYHNHYSHLIRELQVLSIQTPVSFRPINDEYSINAEESSVTGVEGSLLLVPSRRLHVSMNAGRIFSASERFGAIDATLITRSPVPAGEVQVPFLAKWTGSALASYELKPYTFVGLNVTSASHRRITADYQSAVPAENRQPGNANGYARLDLFANTQIRPGLDLRARLSNVLDRRIYSPPFDNSPGYDALWPGRAIRLTLTYSF